MGVSSGRRVHPGVLQNHRLPSTETLGYTVNGGELRAVRGSQQVLEANRAASADAEMCSER